jgi:hypothetical protein
MGSAISEVLPFAIGVAISPAGIIAVILVLFSARARVNGPVFLLGWVVGVASVSTVIYLLADAGDVGSGGSGSDTSYWLKLVGGILLVLLAFRHWRKRSVDSEAVDQLAADAATTLTPVKTGGLPCCWRGEPEEPRALARRRCEPRPAARREVKPPSACRLRCDASSRSRARRRLLAGGEGPPASSTGGRVAPANNTR